MVGMAEVGAPISLDGVTVQLDCWCVCLCYLHFAPENPEDGKMYLLVPAHPGCPGQSPESCKMVVCVCVCVCVCVIENWHKGRNVSSLKSLFPSVLWHCWMGDKKPVQPIKNNLKRFLLQEPSLIHSNFRTKLVKQKMHIDIYLHILWIHSFGS